MAGDLPAVRNGSLRPQFPMPPKVCALHTTMEGMVEAAQGLASKAQKDALVSTAASKESSAALDRARVSYLEEMNKISAQSKAIIDELIVAVKDLKKSVTRLAKMKR
jgi:hypothetical protein